ncbi:MAG: sensor histidine kinase [Arcobacteraceae bacterium]
MHKIKVMFLSPETFLAILINFILIFFICKKILKNMKVLDIKVSQKTEQLEKSLLEKEILLKEIHHRVKNNLTLTISLLELQEEEITDEKTKKVLVDIQERIYTMELLHRKLYESTDLNQISFKNYVHDLTDTIAKSYDCENKVVMDIKMQEIYLSIETAMSYGLLLNELITNAFKYAFKDNKNPIFEIRVTQNEEDIILIVKDNGEGLQKNFDEICNDTLGLKLINMIVRYQLFGTIDYEYEKGAKFTITAPLKKLV